MPANPLLGLALGRIEVNPNLIAELVADELMKSATKDAVEAAAEAAKAAAPDDSGDYRDSITVEEADGSDELVLAVLTSDDYKAHWIEWGSVHQAPQAPLRRGVLAAGLTFKETR